MIEFKDAFYKGIYTKIRESNCLTEPELNQIYVLLFQEDIHDRLNYEIMVRTSNGKLKSKDDFEKID